MARRSLIINTHPFSFCVSSSLGWVFDNIQSLYHSSVLTEPEPEPSQFVDFSVGLQHPRIMGMPQLHRSVFHLDGIEPFVKGPAAHSAALLEWGMNWCVSTNISTFQILHAATVARGPNGVIISGDSGSGKSTLSCGMMASGWRLLTDELTLVNIQTGLIHPFVRPVSIKESAIDVIQVSYRELVLGVVAENTVKGRVSHVRPTDISWHNKTQATKPKLVVFPKYQADVEHLRVEPISALDCFKRLLDQSFNIHVLGHEAISSLRHIAETCRAYTLHYANMNEAIDWINEQVDDD